MKTFFAVTKVIMGMAAVVLWGTVFAGAGALIGCAAGHDLYVPFAVMGFLLGMLCGAIVFKRKIARLHPEVLYGTGGTGTLDDCRYVKKKKKNGKRVWVLRWTYHAPAVGAFARNGKRRKRRRE